MRLAAIESVSADGAIVVGPDTIENRWSEDPDVAACVEVARRAACCKLGRGEGNPFVSSGARVLFVLD